jgi:glycosyltransferase involved in cell wall biosynthesis
MTDPLGQSQVLPYLIGLSKQGHQITLLSTEKKDNFQKRKTVIEQLTTDNNIDWQYIFYTKKPPILSTLYDVFRLRQKAYQLHKKQNFQIVHCRSYISALVGLSFKKSSQTPNKQVGVKLIFDMRGFWADERVDGGLWDLKKSVYKQVYQYFKKKEKEFLQKFDYTISLTECAKQEILSWGLPHCSPIQVIPCCVDVELFKPQSGNSDNSVLINHKPFTISYLGSLGTWYMLDEMLAFFKRLLMYKPFAKLLFITPDEPQMILAAAEKMDIPARNLEIKSAERREVPVLLAQSQVSLFFVKPLYSKKASSPTKMGEILAMGIPIIANTKVGDNEYLFEKYPCGILLENFYPRTFDQVILQLDDLLNIPPNDLRQAALDYFSLDKGIELYNEVYQKLSK